MDNTTASNTPRPVDMRPWVEKYRPTTMEDIVLDDVTRRLLDNIVESGTFPNLMLYGPPGTGKTTTIVNLIDKYRKSVGESGPGMVIHLNASDDRGVDIVRGPIGQFVVSGNMFNKGTKFVVLDEADYMTIQAQSALRQLLQSYPNIKFCLICNYVSKVDVSLRNEFVRIRFNHLPAELIDSLLLEISASEGLGLSAADVSDVRSLFGSDIRSMINFIQSSNDSNDRLGSVLRTSDIELLLQHCANYLSSPGSVKIRQKTITFIKTLCGRGYDISSVLRSLVHHVTVNRNEIVTDDFLAKAEFAIHHTTSDTGLIISYFLDECCKSLVFAPPTHTTH
jgi:replication-associated recombination protein RarA